MDLGLSRLPIGSKIVTRPPRMDSLVFLIGGYLVNPVGVVALFAWQVLSMASYFGVPVVLLTMSFRAIPKYFPQLSG